MKIGILSLQGAFEEHQQMLCQLGVQTQQIRKLTDWQQTLDGLILPGGESTSQSKLLVELGLFDPIKEAIENGFPVFGTCAGLILLGSVFKTMDIDVRRNAYGRQLGSFRTMADIDGVASQFPMTFIRAPYIERTWGRSHTLAQVNGHIVAAQQHNQLVTAFHPELENDTRVHEYFLKMVNHCHR